MFATVCNKNYLIGFEVMLKSLIDNNPRILKESTPFKIISNDLMEEDLKVSKKIYPNIELISFDEEKYNKIKNLEFGSFACTTSEAYIKYELFSLDSDKIIFLDSDVIVLGDIDYLLDFEGPIGAVRDLYIDQFNTGVLVVNKNYINKKITEDLIDLTIKIGVTEHLDQDIINYYFYEDITEIPVSYNYLKTYSKKIFQNTGLPKHIKILHYIVKKPWQDKPLVTLEEGTIWQERYWFEYYNKTLKYRI